MRVPFLDLAAQLETTRPAIERAVLDVVASGRYVGGPVLEAFERSMADYIGVDHAIGVSSGTDALLVSLMALDVGPGDLVVTTPYSFFATAGTVVRLGATPVFIDIDLRTFNMDPARLAEWFACEPERRSRVKAIVPVHLFGQCADMAPILELAAEHGIPVVEDAAQALGARYPRGGGNGVGRAGGSRGAGGGGRDAERGGCGDRPAGSKGTLACFSFYPTKNLGAMGDAGLVVTSDAVLAERVRRLRNHGAHTEYRHPEVGGNFRLDTLQAAILAAKLPHLDGWHARRRERAAYYDEHLAVPGVELPVAAWGRERHTYHQYVIRVPERRDALRARLAERRIDTMIYYPVPLHRQPCFHHLGHAAGAFPCSEDAAARSLALPIYPELAPAMQDRVIEETAAFYGGSPASDTESMVG
ncbi:MAG: DegT/DnrJ/EryC1/StrS family aminotransferase [Acidobacteriota bacterium]|nr:DegT/DnrJ/EryC1/StrS family aminotransferase [Acidobacteriota bacterium]